MIKANELRVGSWVLYPHTQKELFQITEPRQIELAYILLPIPLSPEWLQRCGFEKEKSKTAGIELYRLKDIIIEHEVEAEKYNAAPFALAFDQDNLIVYPLSYHPEFVHQLQNLYFALTGEELNVKI